MRSNMSIDVTYVIPAYNAAAHVAGAVRSALAQTDVRVEVIVVDDGSSDNTAEVVFALADQLASRIGREATNCEAGRGPMVQLICLPENGGPSRARNSGIAAARGRWIGILDADDALECDRTRHLLSLAESSGAQIVSDNFSRIVGEGHAVSTAFRVGREPYSFLIIPTDYILDNIPMARPKGNNFGSGYLKPLFRADLLAGAPATGAPMIRYDEKVRVGEDFLFCLEAMIAGGLYVVSSRPGYRYSVREGSLSHRIGPGHIADLEAGMKRLHMRRSEQSTPKIDAAVERYLTGLERTRSFLSLTAQAKGGAILRAASEAGRRPDIWPLIARFGMEALAKRAGLRRR